MVDQQPKALSVTLLICRLIAGIGFLLAASLKLKNPDTFMHSINAFEIIPEGLIPLVTPYSAYLIPWSEVVVGLALIFGFWGRSSGIIATTIYGVFTLAIISALLRGLDLNCGCFGDLFGENGLGWSSIVRNLVFISASLAVAIWGAGVASLDTVLSKRGNTSPSTEASEA